MVYAPVHAALIPPQTTGLSPDEIEGESVRAVLAYLTSGTPGAALAPPWAPSRGTLTPGQASPDGLDSSWM